MSQNKQQQTNQTKAATIQTPIYGAVEFAKPAMLRKIEKYGRVSCPAIECRVPINGTGLAVVATIWGERKETKDGIEVEFTASLPAKSVIPFGTGAEDGRENFIEHVESSAVHWPGYESATDAALALLTGTKVKGDRKERTRLVKRPAAERPAQQPSA